MKRKWFSLLLVSILAITLVACGSTSENNTDASDSEVSDNNTATSASDTSQDTVTVRIGLMTSQVLPVIALENGYFEEEGVNVELITFDSGAAEVEAFTSGELDIANIGDLPFINGIINGVDLKIVGFYKSSVKDVLLVTRTDAGISDFSDLKGKTVSVPVGTNAQPILYEFLEAGGLTEDDVEILNLSATDGANAILSNDVQAAITWDPYASTAVASGKAEIFSDTSDFRALVCPIVTSSTFIDEQSDAVEKVLRAMEKAADYAANNNEDAARLVADYFGAESSDSYLTSIINTDLDVKLTEEKVEDLKLGAQKCYQYGVVEEEVNPEDYVNWDFQNIF